MRLIRSLFMLLALLTLSTGFGVTTTNPKQNSKTECGPISIANMTDFVKVVTFENASFDAVSFGATASTIFVLKANPPLNFYAVIADLGWQSNQRLTKIIPYKEKLLENYNLHFKSKLLFDSNLVRDNC